MGQSFQILILHQLVFNRTCAVFSCGDLEIEMSGCTQFIHNFISQVNKDKVMLRFITWPLVVQPCQSALILEEWYQVQQLCIQFNFFKM